MTIRAKFQLQEVINYAYGTKKYIFRPQYDTSIPEDARFAKASPSGEFSISVDNPAVFDQFEVGKHYYFDINPVPEAVPAPASA